MNPIQNLTYMKITLELTHNFAQVRATHIAAIFSFHFMAIQIWCDYENDYHAAKRENKLDNRILSTAYSIR